LTNFIAKKMNFQQYKPEISKPYKDLLERISRRFVVGQAQAVRSVNEAIIGTNWEIGKYIICQTLSDKLNWESN